MLHRASEATAVMSLDPWTLSVNKRPSPQNDRLGGLRAGSRVHTRVHIIGLMPQ